METGTIVRLMPKGYGFIEQEGKEDNIFFHADNLVGNLEFDELQEGDDLQFEVEETPKGLSANNVTRAQASDDDADVDADDDVDAEDADTDEEPLV